MEMARVIREIRPRYVFVENSPMLTSRGLGRVLGDLAALGYDARWGVLGASDVGSLHQRDRIWIRGEQRGGQGADSDCLHEQGIQSSGVDAEQRTEPSQRSAGSLRVRAESEVMLWPTPTVCGNYNRKGASPTSGDGLATVVSQRWPTIRAADGERGGRGDLIQAVRGNPNSHYTLWQTPVADDAVNRTSGKVNSRGEPKLSAQVLRWPTPTKNANHDCAAERERNTPALASAVAMSEASGGQLSPDWVELLMGWPRCWTALDPMRAEDWTRWLAGDHWGAEWEDGTPRTASNVAHRAKRLKAIGNGQVSMCAATMWRVMEAP